MNCAALEQWDAHLVVDIDAGAEPVEGASDVFVSTPVLGSIVNSVMSFEL